jgi:hypothetical protein
MARTSERLAFVFALVLAMAVTVVAIKAWAGPPDPEGDSAAPIPPRETAALESVLKVRGQFPRSHGSSRDDPCRASP